MARSASRPALVALPLALLLAGTVALAGWQLVAGSRLREAGQWIDRAQAWQVVLIVTAEAIEDGSLKPAEGGGFHLPWEAEGTHPFPVTAGDVADEVQGMIVAYPLPIEPHGEAARRATDSHERLSTELAGIERLGPLATVTGLPPLLRAAAIDAGGLLRPVNELLGREAEEAGRAGLLLSIAALVCAAVLLAVVVRFLRVRKTHGRLVRHLEVLEGRREPTPD